MPVNIFKYSFSTETKVLHQNFRRLTAWNHTQWDSTFFEKPLGYFYAEEVFLSGHSPVSPHSSFRHARRLFKQLGIMTKTQKVLQIDMGFFLKEGGICI